MRASGSVDPARARGPHDHLRIVVHHLFSALCGYDRGELGDEAVTEHACRHPLGHLHAVRVEAPA